MANASIMSTISLALSAFKSNNIELCSWHAVERETVACLVVSVTFAQFEAEVQEAVAAIVGPTARLLICSILGAENPTWSGTA